MKTMKMMMGVGSVGLAIVAGMITLDDVEPETSAVSEIETSTASVDEAEADRRSARIFRIAANEPSLSYDEIETLVEQTDQMREQVGEHGELDLGEAVRQRLADVEIDEGEAMTWFRDHRELFGQRSFEQSRHTVERLIAIEQVREQLAGP